MNKTPAEVTFIRHNEQAERGQFGPGLIRNKALAMCVFVSPGSWWRESERLVGLGGGGSRRCDHAIYPPYPPGHSAWQHRINLGRILHFPFCAAAYSWGGHSHPSYLLGQRQRKVAQTFSVPLICSVISTHRDLPEGCLKHDLQASLL